MWTPDFYNENASRAYPVDDAATGIDDSGAELPPDAVVDARILLPRANGAFAFIAALSAGPSIATLVCCASKTQATDLAGGAAAAFSPLAAVTVVKPKPGMIYALEGLTPGAGGWVVFGQGVVDDRFSFRFSSPRQSQLAGRCVREITAPPIPSIAAESARAVLSGVVELVGVGGIKVVAATRVLDGAPRRAIVFSLGGGLPGAKDPLATFAGPCGARPESGNCFKIPLRGIGSVVPDCNGNIDVQVIGATATAFPGGLGVDLATSPSALCPSPADAAPPENRCATPPATTGSSACALDTPAGLTVGVGPWFDAFASPPVVADGWNTLDGTWATATEPRPSTPLSPGGASVPVWTTTSTARRAVATFSPPNAPTFNSLARYIETALRPWAGDLNSNGGIVLNRTIGAGCRPRYHIVVVNAISNALELYRYDGASLKLIKSATPQTAFAQGSWYRLQTTAHASPTVPGGVDLTSTATGLTNTMSTATTLAYTTTKFGPSGGRHGLGANSSRCSFGYFYLATG